MIEALVLFAVCLAAPLLVSFLLDKVIRKSREELDDDEVALMNASMTVLSGAFTFLVAFLIVNVWGAQVERVETLGSELTQLNRLYNQRNLVPFASGDELKRHVVDYLHKVKENEVLRAGPPDGDREANQLRSRILKLVADARPSMPREGVDARLAELFVTTAQDWADARQIRLSKTYAQLSGVYIAVVIALGVLVLFVSAVLSKGAKPRIVLVKVVGVDLMVGLLLGLLFFTGSPSFVLGDETGKLDRMETVIQTELPVDEAPGPPDGARP